MHAFRFNSVLKLPPFHEERNYQTQRLFKKSFKS